ncbi:alkaline phosphatase family protein [Psychrobium sp. MM17-31]|uniref:alkaline phosphatase family protein n=1 Tax=Psychrobium sp. MM17-31 TaxID=2917758 RepID=UPI001EF6DC08|nr:alkaline phosphatase family protein [Psychrobium sp. MM17-31]MCG7530716.1 alkaline phosphatase family protein [Psychrobium sp. MM17-31]
MINRKLSSWLGLLATLSLISCSSHCDNVNAVQPIERKVLLIGVDGLMYSYIDSVNDAKLNDVQPPNFARLSLSKAHVGGMLSTQTYQASSSGPSWASILTGTWVNRHKIPRNNKQPVQVKGIFNYLHELFPKAKMGSYAAWTPINAGHLVKDMAYVSHRIDGASHPKGEGVDDFITRKAVADLADPASDLLFTFVHLDDIDHAGHACGWCGLYEKKVAKTDKRLGRLLDAVQTREQRFNEEWLVLLVSDHGHKQQGGHGGDLLVERTSVIGTNRPQLMNKLFKQPAKALALTDNAQQNQLVAYPAITAIVPTIMSYLAEQPSKAYHFDSASLIGPLGVHKLYGKHKVVRKQSAAVIDLAWQVPLQAGVIELYRNNQLVTELAAGTTSYSETLTEQDLGVGPQVVNYTLVAKRGSAVSTQLSFNLGQLPDKAAIIKKALISEGFRNALGDFTWRGGFVVPYAPGNSEDDKAVVLNRKRGFATTSLPSIDGKMTIAAWIYLDGSVMGDPNIIANKDWRSGGNPGFTLYLKDQQIGFNIGGNQARNDIKPIAVPKKQWFFTAITIDAEHQSAQLTVFDVDSGLHQRSIELQGKPQLDSGLPLTLGEGGLGRYNLDHKLNARLSQFYVFSEVLSTAELLSLASK